MPYGETISEVERYKHKGNFLIPIYILIISVISFIIAKYVLFDKEKKFLKIDFENSKKTSSFNFLITYITIFSFFIMFIEFYTIYPSIFNFEKYFLVSIICTLTVTSLALLYIANKIQFSKQNFYIFKFYFVVSFVVFYFVVSLSVKYINILLSTANAKTVTVQIQNKFSKRMARRFISIQTKSLFNEKQDIQINNKLYQQKKVGDFISLHLRDGFFGIEWLEQAK